MPLRIDRYVATAIARPLAPIVGVLVLIFASFDVPRTLADFQGAQLDTATVAQMVGFKTLIALDVLLPLALYLAVIIGLAGLHQNREIIALRSLGIAPLRTVTGILVVALAVAVVVGAVSLLVRPWAYSQVHGLESRLEANLGIDDLVADRFRIQDDGRVIYVQQGKGGNPGFKGLFAYERDDGHSKITLARRIQQPRERTLLLTDARSYWLERRGQDDWIQGVKELTLHLREPQAAADSGRKAMSTAELLRSQDPVEIAERQWRISRPLVTVLIALAAIPLSATAPRRGPYARIFGALVLFAIYFSLGDMARSWVEQARVPPLPGIWWLHGLLAIALVMTASSWRRR